jgi:hypothetical protein
MLVLDALVDLFAMHRDILGGIDSQTDLIAFDPQHGDGDFIAHHDRFTHSSRQNQHLELLAIHPLIRDRPRPVMSR